MGAQISINFPSLPVISSPALSRLGNIRQEEMHTIYDFVQEVLIKSQNNTEETSTLLAGSPTSGNFHDNYSDKTCLLAWWYLEKLPGVWYSSEWLSHPPCPHPCHRHPQPYLPKNHTEKPPYVSDAISSATSRSQEAGPSWISLGACAQRPCGHAPAPTAPPPQPPLALDGPS